MESSSDPPAPASNLLPLLGYFDGLIDDLRRLVPLALCDWDEESIHQSRVATRRLKAGVDLFRPVLSDEARRPFVKVTRRLRRRLGLLRDLDVMLGHLDALSKQHRHVRAVAWLMEHLRAEREAARNASTKSAAVSKVLAKLSSWQDVRAQVMEAADAIDPLLVQSIHLQLDAFIEQADRLSRPPMQPGAEAGAAAVQDVHQLRIAGKVLRYTLEMAGAHGRPLEPRVMRAFKSMQEALGLWHDYVVLTEWTMRGSLDALLAHHDTKLQAEVLALARLTLSRAEQQLSKFTSLWMKEGSSLAQTIRGSFPITARAGHYAILKGSQSVRDTCT